MHIIILNNTEELYMFKHFAAPMALTLLLSACATQQFDIAPTSGAKPSFNENQTFWLGGLGQEETVDGAKACGDASKVARVETQLTAGNIALTILTLGIYAPRNIAITCTP
jgi:hypothetical protein